MSKIPTRTYQLNGDDTATEHARRFEHADGWISKAVRNYRAIELCINRRKS